MPGGSPQTPGIFPGGHPGHFFEHPEQRRQFAADVGGDLRKGKISPPEEILRLFQFTAAYQLPERVSDLIPEDQVQFRTADA